MSSLLICNNLNYKSLFNLVKNILITRIRENSPKLVPQGQGQTLLIDLCLSIQKWRYINFQNGIIMFLN